MVKVDDFSLIGLLGLLSMVRCPNMIDHINGIKDDNSISNLRSCTNQQNSLNKGKQSNNTSWF